MTKYISIISNNDDPEKCSQKLADELEQNAWVRLEARNTNHINIDTRNFPIGPGIIMQGGGSTGKYNVCLHPCSHFNQSAFATAQWMIEQGIEPRKCCILNPLPIHHVSGFLPWWRSRCWGAKHIWITNNLIRDSDKLEALTKAILSKKFRPIVTSLVPTQLYQLLKSPSGVRWLQSCEIIWIGGSAISGRLAVMSRNLKIRLAPCYGTTETAAMITAQTPEEFLSGENCLGSPLNDVELSIGPKKSLLIRTQRLAKILLQDGSLKSLADIHGWWESGDAADLIIQNKIQKLKIIGRRDTAINSGGEIVFPEILQARLLDTGREKGIPIKELLLISIQDEKWGERLVALFRLNTQGLRNEQDLALLRLKDIVNNWSPYEQPVAWYHCPELTKNKLGKWEINKWKDWLTLKRSNTSI